jgi:hypothetical protein
VVDAEMTAAGQCPGCGDRACFRRGDFKIGVPPRICLVAADLVDGTVTEREPMPPGTA